MRHEWIFDVLKDLQAYARENDLPRLAEVAEEALDVARAEVAGREPEGGPPEGRPN